VSRKITMDAGVRPAKKGIRSAWFFVLLASASVLPRFAIANDFSLSGNSFSKHVYVSTGLGLSHLNPDTSEVSTDVNDRVNPAGQITLGVDINKWFSLEAHSADLGSAGLTTDGRINYHVHGTSGLLYIGRARSAHVRRGFKAFGRLGFGYLDNSSVGNVQFERDNPVHLLFGGGLEYTNSYGLGARLELFSFDNDAFYSQLALVYRFGGRHKTAPAIVAAVEEWQPILSSSALAPPVPAVAVINPDKDGDGVPNELDQCPDTAPNISVNAEGCALFNGIADGVTFYSNSARLTGPAKDTLDTIVELLLKHKSVSATVSAHTDDWGEEEYNLILSGKRAASVVNYLIEQGVGRARLAAESFGEFQPIDTNRTADGRERNRRVEIVVQKELL